MAWSYVGGTSFGTASGSTATPALPTGWAANDISVIAVAIGSAAQTINTPTGYTLLDTGLSDAAESAAAFYRIMQTGDVATAVSWGGTPRAAGQLVVFRGAYVGAAVESHNVTNISTSSTAATTTSITAAAATDLALALFTSNEAASGTAQTYTTPTGYTLPTVTGTNPIVQGATTVRQTSVAVFYKVLSSTTAEAPSSTLASSSAHRNFLLMLRSVAPANASKQIGVTQVAAKRAAFI